VIVVTHNQSIGNMAVLEEKERLLPVNETPVQQPKARQRSRFLLKLLLLAALLLFSSHIVSFGRRLCNLHRGSGNAVPQCPQVAPLFPSAKSKELERMDEYFQTSKFRNESIARLSGAVKIPTMSYDHMGPVGDDTRWEIFYDFAAYLKEQFPLIHQTLSLEMVNVHGLLYTWQGSDESLKPTLLMAHQDVVPVPEVTIPQWTHPPFAGFFDGKYIWYVQAF